MEEILEQVIEIVKETMDVEEVTPETLMEDELGISSLEFYELLNNLESAFGIKIPEKILSNVETVEDIAYEVNTILERKG
ncbi:MAG: acyl carrier protein [Lachnospiraceae bacterium]|nr:acyl carrier protein [Lachnospiraceae bacterium]